MFPLIEKVLGKSAGSRDIHRRILSHVPAAYRPITRMVSSAFNAACGLQPRLFAQQVDAVKAMIAANDVRCLKFVAKKFGWDLSSALYYAFDAKASVETILYVREMDVTVERGVFENFMYQFNRKDVLETFSPDFLGLSKKSLIENAVLKNDVRMLDFWLSKLGRKSKRMMGVWNVFADMEDGGLIIEYHAIVVHWAIVNKICFPENYDASFIIYCFSLIETKTPQSTFTLFTMLVEYARYRHVKLEIGEEDDHSYFTSSYEKRCLAFLLPEECVCKNSEFHKGRLI